MVSPESAVRRLMRETGKLLQPYGFDSAEANGTRAESGWTRVEDAGVASVTRTRTVRNWTGGQQELRFGLALDATPLAWWEYRNWRNTQLGLAALPREQAEGPGLLAMSGLPSHASEPWSLRLDPQQPGHALQADIDVIRAQLPRRVHLYARRALRLLQPGVYLDELLAQPDPGLDTWVAIVVLLGADGPGSQLDHACEQLRLFGVQHDAASYAGDVIDYAHGQAAAVH
ncbi:hypothetical protein ACIP5Y_22765 [Nocardia sp. NPDC088792]|uniref:hypothetical protein n=1 Tax=Nocardia sp. NPDC088792 TaxID=3364332 RepID=UPI003803EAF3